MVETAVRAATTIVLDAGLAVLHLSPLAQALLAAHADVLTVHQQRLRAPLQPQALQRGLAAAADAAGQGRSAWTLLRPGRQPLTLRAERLPFGGTGGTGCIAVTLRDPELDTPDPLLLQGLFGLTPTEALVAAALAQGQDCDAVALAMGVQANTVRSHIKRLLAKSGLRRQAQLVSLVLRSVAMTSAVQPASAGPRSAGAAPPGAGCLAQMGSDSGEAADHSRIPAPGAELNAALQTITDCRKAQGCL